ncbi:MAG: hypothetical protein V5A38_13725 [Halolamina sp.]|uniref:hypothetical protein n=1 Tax=Halolamina sp. TaxID=1940283 RepID=UPI002FC32523
MAERSLPTRRGDWRLIARTVRLVLSLPAYAVLAFVAATTALSTFVLSQNPQFVSAVVINGSADPVSRLRALLGLYPGFGSAYSVPVAVVLLSISVLVGVNIAMLVYHVRTHDLGAREGTGSAAGVALGIVGAGCAACGSAILGGVLTLVGAGAALTLLPLHGLEFALLAFVAVLLSLFWIAQGMRGGEVAGCPVEIE